VCVALLAAVHWASWKGCLGFCYMMRILFIFDNVVGFGIVMQVVQGLSTRDLMLILQKQLSPSGVSSLGRIVLPKVVGSSLSVCVL
jgi:hypothetical protein